MKKTTIKKIIIAGLVTFLLFGLLYFSGILKGRSTGAYLVDTYCYTDSQAQAVADAEIKFRGYCHRGCYSTRSTNAGYREGDCPSDRNYIAKCDDTYSSGTCNNDNLINECSSDEIGNQGSCSSGKVCVRKPTGRRCIDSSDYVCPTAMKYSINERRCIRIGCQTDDSCKETETCILKSDKSSFVCVPSGQYFVLHCGSSGSLTVCKNICVLKEASQITTDFWVNREECEKANGIETTKKDISITFSSIQLPNKVAVGKDFEITGFFVASEENNYIISADLDESSFQAFVITGKSGSGCSKTPYSSGGSQLIFKGTPTAFKLTMTSPENPGIYDIKIAGGLNCQSLIESGSVVKQIQVGEPASDTTPPGLFDETGNELVEGGDCSKDYKTTCQSGNEITVFKCNGGTYTATDEICSEDEIDPSVDDSGRKYLTQITNFFEQYKTESIIVSALVVILIIVGVFMFTRKKGR